MEKKASKRVYYLDWLRVLGMLSVFIYHSSRFFNLGDWHVKNPTTYMWVEIWDVFATTWLMPLMFVISGASLFFSVEKPKAGIFVKDKFLRLLVPVIVCSFTHASLQVYLERFTHGQFIGSYFQFLPYYFQGIYDGNNPDRGNFAVTGMHLWYLVWLFLFSVLLFPLLKWLKGKGRSVLSKIGEVLALPGMLYTLALPSMLLLIFVDPDGPAFIFKEAGWPVVIYLWLTFSGFLVISNEGLQGSIRRIRWISLVLGIVLMAIPGYLLYVYGEPEFGTARYSLMVGTHSLSAWCLVMAFFGFGIRHLERSSPFLSYANEAVLPFYILHQTVLLVVGYFVVQWPIPDLLKWIAIVLVSFASIMLIYEYLVRRFNVMRFLFGMKVLPKKSTVQSPDAVMTGSTK